MRGRWRASSARQLPEIAVRPLDAAHVDLWVELRNEIDPQLPVTAAGLRRWRQNDRTVEHVVGYLDGEAVGAAYAQELGHLRHTNVAGAFFGVVAGERADDHRMLQPVERAGDGRRRAELRLEDDDVPGCRHAATELAQDRPQRLLRIGAARVPRRVVPGPTERVVRLLEAELADVSRHRRLRHDAARVGKRVDQLELRSDPLPRDDALDQTMPFGLAQRSRSLHNGSI